MLTAAIYCWLCFVCVQSQMNQFYQFEIKAATSPWSQYNFISLFVHNDENTVRKRNAIFQCFVTYHPLFVDNREEKLVAFGILGTYPDFCQTKQKTNKKLHEGRYRHYGPPI